jgi:hypothetical protein
VERIVAELVACPLCDRLFNSQVGHKIVLFLFGFGLHTKMLVFFSFLDSGYQEFVALTHTDV